MKNFSNPFKFSNTTYSVRIQHLENKWAPSSACGPKFERGESGVPTHFTTHFFWPITGVGLFRTARQRSAACQRSKINDITSLWLVKLNCAFYPLWNPTERTQTNTHSSDLPILGSEFFHYTLLINPHKIGSSKASIRVVLANLCWIRGIGKLCVE